MRHKSRLCRKRLRLQSPICGKVDELSAKVDQAIVEGREVFSQEIIDLAKETSPDEEPVAEKVVAKD